MRTTHVGSLVRPDDLVAFLRKRDAGEAYDSRPTPVPGAVRSRVVAQAARGRDRHRHRWRDGKSAWNYYVYERLGASSCARTRSSTPTSRAVNDSPTDWTRFPEFYADYFANEQEFDCPGGDCACVEKVTYTAGRRSGATSPTSRRRCRRRASRTGFLPVVAPASCFPNSSTSTTARRRTPSWAIAEALREEYRAIVDAGLTCSRRRVHPVHVRLIVPPRQMGDYRAWAQPRIDAVNHALEGIPEDRVRYHVCWGSWNGPHTNDIPLREIARPILQVNAGTTASRPPTRATSTSGGLAGRGAARGQDAHARHRQPRHQRRGAPGARGRAARAASPRRRPRERHRRHGLRFPQGWYIIRVHPEIQWAKLRVAGRGRQARRGGARGLIELFRRPAGRGRNLPGRLGASAPPPGAWLHRALLDDVTPRYAGVALETTGGVLLVGRLVDERALDVFAPRQGLHPRPPRRRPRRRALVEPTDVPAHHPGPRRSLGPAEPSIARYPICEGVRPFNRSAIKKTLEGSDPSSELNKASGRFRRGMADRRWPRRSWSRASTGARARGRGRSSALRRSSRAGRPCGCGRTRRSG